MNLAHIEHDLIESFFESMEMDLEVSRYDRVSFDEYIYGSAEVVGLMCLYVFLEGDEQRYQKLLPFARSLGAAFQKVNFLRDIKSDYDERGRTYFPGADFEAFTQKDKETIEKDIQQDFDHAYLGIRWGVFLAYIYYLALFKKIKHLPPKAILNARVRINDYYKLLLLIRTWFQHQLNLI